MVKRDMVVSGVSDKFRGEQFVRPPGTGGVGKTAMALAIGHAATVGSGGNIGFADLESPTDPCRITGAVSSAMEVALSPKRTKSGTRGRSLTGPKRSRALLALARPAPSSTGAQGMQAGNRRARERLAEAAMQQTATSEMLRLVSNSPIQSVLDAVAEHAARLCDASNARIWRLEDNLLRLAASYGESSVTMDGPRACRQTETR